MLSNCLKMAYEERLDMSRKLFDLSRKRVESLKRNKNVKRSCRRIEKPGETDWITSGSLGSRDAVLVFRTNILNTHTQQPRSSSSDTSILSVNAATTASNDGSKNNSIKLDKKLEATPTPSTSRNSTGNSFSNSVREKGGASAEAGNEKNAFHKQKPNQLVCIIQSENRSRLSLSSSETSIGSDAEDVGGNAGEGADNEMFTSLDTNISGDTENDDDDDGDDDDDDDQSPEIEECNEYAPVQGMPAIDLKIKYKFHQTETLLLRKIFTRHGLREAHEDENFNVLWTGVHMKPDVLRNLAPYQRVNHFPRSYEMTRKDRLYKNIERMQHLRGFKHFDIIPQSFIVPLEYRDLVSAHNKTRGPWIVKPTASSRGRGIFIVNSPDQIPQDEQVLVSKYVAEPLCIDGHKCDLRVYVLVTSFDPLIIYMYEEGLVRLATVKYNLNADNLWNPCMHLCNYSINKYHTDYVKSSAAHEEDVGHKWTLSALLRHLKSHGCDTRLLMTNIEDLIIKSIFSCAQSIIAACRMFVPNGNNCFELYGFDILIDDTLKPWLLEVNLSPSMGVDSPLDAKVKATLITDLLTCVGIPAITPAMRAHYDSKWTRFRNVTYKRRTNSAEPMDLKKQISIPKRSSLTATAPSRPFTLEEQRIVRNARLQNARRGGFVRIFPTEDSMTRYCNYLDPLTGIPLSTPVLQCQSYMSAIVQHNHNQMVFKSLYGKPLKDGDVKEENSIEDRMEQYERVIETASPITFSKKRVEPKCKEKGKILRKQIIKYIEEGAELTQLQARQAFSLYLESILRRLTQEPKDCHEKLILKFLYRVGGAVKAPVFFSNPQNMRPVSKARSAMVAKLLCDFLEQYNRDTEAYVDSFDHFAMIPTNLFVEFLSQAQEGDLEAVLTLNTNLMGTMPYLYNRCGLSVPPTPPIPSGVHGFLKALPAMVQTGSGSRDFNKCDSYYKNSDGMSWRSTDTTTSRRKYLTNTNNRR
ncbi:tubulin polyglutamylase TTLL5 [Glossina fuscipes]|uniref:Tubulin--tyrosine ligase-like protein 5 n=1 Tax=Glossina fuscipes TaxID=7396 RepID=A0A9C5Z6N1_9MUSC|nr:tubulin polyglutamylase TTLL5 [Glossina fuscipes]